MTISREVVKIITSEWIGQRLSDEEVESLAARYETLTRAIASFPDAEAYRLEPPLVSLPAPAPWEARR